MDDAIVDLAEFIYESDLIEGIHDDPELLMLQVKTRKKDGHVGAILMLESLAQDMVNHYVDKRVICDAQKLITAEQHKKPGGHKLSLECIGEYRRFPVKVGNKTSGYRECPPSDQVPYLMRALLQRAHWWQQRARFWSWDQNVNEVARLHFEFEIIHPFADGNGRTGRALAYYMLRYAGLKPFVFTNHDKGELYYPCFNMNNDPGPMRRYFFIKMEQGLTTLPI